MKIKRSKELVCAIIIIALLVSMTEYSSTFFIGKVETATTTLSTTYYDTYEFSNVNNSLGTYKWQPPTYVENGVFLFGPDFRKLKFSENTTIIVSLILSVSSLTNHSAYISTNKIQMDVIVGNLILHQKYVFTTYVPKGKENVYSEEKLLLNITPTEYTYLNNSKLIHNTNIDLQECPIFISGFSAIINDTMDWGTIYHKISFSILYVQQKISVRTYPDFISYIMIFGGVIAIGYVIVSVIKRIEYFD